MNEDFSKLKKLNSKLKKGNISKMLYVIAMLISTGIILLILNSDAFLTAAVILIFIAIIISMISFFIYLVSKQRVLKQKIKNSILVIYPQSVNIYNSAYISDFQINQEVLKSSIFQLFPDYCEFESMVSFFDENSGLKSYFTRLYINGREGRITPIFNGIYSVIPISSTVNFYYERLYGALEHLAKAVTKRPHLSDDSIPTLFHNKIDFMGGQLSIQPSKEIPNKIVDVIKVIEKNHPNISFRLGIKDQQLHIAIQNRYMYPPYIKKYHEKEKQMIQAFVSNILKDMSDILHVLDF